MAFCQALARIRIMLVNNADPTGHGSNRTWIHNKRKNLIETFFYEVELRYVDRNRQNALVSDAQVALFETYH